MGRWRRGHPFPLPPPIFRSPSAHACIIFLVPFCRHQTHELIKRHQNAARQLGKSFRVGSGDVFIVQDFGKLQPHFPVLTLVLYWDDQLFYYDFVMQKCREDPKPRKDGNWVTAAWRWMLYYLRCLPQPVRRVLVWSDTGPNEFRTSRNLGQFRRLAMSFGVRLSVAYACAHHGHSVADGHFGTLSRMERRAERQPGWSPSDVLDTAERARNTTVLNLGAMQGSYERTRTVYLNLAGVTGGYGLRCFSHFEFHANGKVDAYATSSGQNPAYDVTNAFSSWERRMQKPPPRPADDDVPVEDQPDDGSASSSDPMQSRRLSRADGVDASGHAIEPDQSRGVASAGGGTLPTKGGMDADVLAPALCSVRGRGPAPQDVSDGATATSSAEIAAPLRATLQKIMPERSETIVQWHERFHPGTFFNECGALVLFAPLRILTRNPLPLLPKTSISHMSISLVMTSLCPMFSRMRTCRRICPQRTRTDGRCIGWLGKQRVQKKGELNGMHRPHNGAEEEIGRRQESVRGQVEAEKNEPIIPRPLNGFVAGATWYESCPRRNIGRGRG